MRGSVHGNRLLDRHRILRESVFFVKGPRFLRESGYGGGRHHRILWELGFRRRSHEAVPKEALLATTAAYDIWNIRRVDTVSLKNWLNKFCILSTQPANEPKRYSFPKITIYHYLSLVTVFFFDKVARLGMNIGNFQNLMLIHQFRKSLARIKRL